MRKINKIVLISPTSTRPGFISKSFRFPPLNLALLAALAPGYSYKIIDENIDGVDLELEEIKEADLIGITVMTAQTPRAYELADRFRGMGKTVIMGGMHVSAILKRPLAYEHIEPGGVGNKRRVLVSDLSGKGNIKYKANEMGLALGGNGYDSQKIVKEIKRMEEKGLYQKHH